MATLGQQIRIYRLLSGVSQKTLGAACNRSQVWASLIEPDKLRPSRRQLKKIGRTLGVPLHEERAP